MTISSPAISEINSSPVVTPAATSIGGADFNMFLKLLTTQMQNQDPLDPMDTAQYTQQLAQYSQVEQTVQQTATLKEILARFSTQDIAQASSFIGRQVLVDSPQAGLGSAPASWTYASDQPVTSMRATIMNAAGVVVDQRDVVTDTGIGSFAWDGKLADGSTAAQGAYKLSMVALDANGGLVPVTIKSAGRVSEVTSSAGVIQLGINGISLPASLLLSIAQAAN